jgi:hypothetical protein
MAISPPGFPFEMRKPLPYNQNPVPRSPSVIEGHPLKGNFMVLRRFVLLIGCLSLLGCPSSNNNSPAPKDVPSEEVSEGSPCSVEFPASIAAGAWEGTSFSALETGDSLDIVYGSQGGRMLYFDLLATGAGPQASPLTIEFRSPDGSTVHQTEEYSSVDFSCQNAAGWVSVNLIFNVESTPQNEPLTMVVQGSFAVEGGDPIVVTSEVAVALE